MCPPFEMESVRRSKTATAEGSETIRIWLLGGFWVSVGSRIIGEGAWRLKKAAALVKLLALSPATASTASRLWTSYGPTRVGKRPPTIYAGLSTPLVGSSTRPWEPV